MKPGMPSVLPADVPATSAWRAIRPRRWLDSGSVLASRWSRGNAADLSRRRPEASPWLTVVPRRLATAHEFQFVWRVYLCCRPSVLAHGSSVETVRSSTCPRPAQGASPLPMQFILVGAWGAKESPERGGWIPAGFRHLFENNVANGLHRAFGQIMQFKLLDGKIPALRGVVPFPAATISPTVCQSGSMFQQNRKLCRAIKVVSPRRITNCSAVHVPGIAVREESSCLMGRLWRSMVIRPEPSCAGDAHKFPRCVREIGCRVSDHQAQRRSSQGVSVWFSWVSSL